MLENFIFENHLGLRFIGLDNGVYMNYNDLRDYSWNYDTINNKISRFYRSIKDRKLPLVIYCSSDEKAIEIKNQLHELAESDIEAKIPGKVFIGDYYTKGYITASSKSDYLISKRMVKLTLTLTSDNPAWYKEQTSVFTKGAEEESAKPVSGTASCLGALRIDDISPKTHIVNVRLSSDTVEDFSSVTVCKYGKNLFDFTKEPNFNTNVTQTITKIDDVTMRSTISFASGGGNGILLGCFDKGTKLTVSGYYKLSENATERFTNLLSVKKDGVVTNYTKALPLVTEYVSFSHTITLSEGGECYYRPAVTDFYSSSNAVYVDMKNIQVEIGENVTNYEAFKEPQIVTANANGTVGNILSLAPTTTLVSDTEGVTITADYTVSSEVTGDTESANDYPYDYSYDYFLSGANRKIVCNTVRDSNFRLKIYGEITNPSVVIGGHTYAIVGTVGKGESLLIDSIEKTITLTTSAGNKVNWFDKRNRVKNIFQLIPSGQNTVVWNGTFGFDLTVIEERSEPKWT